MRYAECDGCGKRLQGDSGFTIIMVRLGPHGDGEGHACTNECIPAAADTVLKRALDKVKHPRDR